MISERRETNKLLEYLRIKTVQPEPDYETAIKFIRQYSEEIGFDSYKEVEVHPNRIVCILTYLGKSPEKPTLLLNSHIDVVPCDDKYWKCDPYEAKIQENGDIFSRGIQDMKSLAIAQLEAVRRMKEANIRPERTIHLTFVPDEELGGMTGFSPFLETQEFKDLNVGFGLDEGRVNPDDQYRIYYGERIAWWLYLTFRGNTGHGSRPIDKTAAEKMQRLLNKLLAYREQQKEKFRIECMQPGDVNGVNLTEIHGGLGQRNVVPPEIKAIFDLRLSTNTNPKEFEQMLVKWIEEAEGEDADSGKISYEFQSQTMKFALTSMEDDKNPWWKTFKATGKELGMKISDQIFPSGTDARFLRQKGVPAFGFTPFLNTPQLSHDHNEYLNEKDFLAGLDVYYKIVLDLANMA